MAIRAAQNRDFAEACREAVGSLRGALIELYASVGADPTRPQDVSRRFKLDKSLTWKVSRALRLDDALAAAAVLPGASGIDILLDVMHRSGAPEAAVDEVRRASAEYERVIEVHTGDRETLRLILDSMGRNGKSLELSRKQAFRGSSGIWGLQCAVRLSAYFVAPSTEGADLLDLALVAGWNRVRRLRPVPRWPILEVREIYDDGSDRMLTRRREPLDVPDGDGGWFLRSFSSGALPEIHVQQVGAVQRFELGEGPVGRTGEFSCYTGHLDRAAVPRFASGGETSGQFRVGITFPAETLLFDLLVHRDLTEAMSPELAHFARLPEYLNESDESQRLPIDVRVVDLGPNPSLATPLVDRYDALIDAAMTRAGWNRQEFRCFRVAYKYPPVLTTVRLMYPLPRR